MLCFFGGSQTSLCCGDRAWYLRHSHLIRDLFLFRLLRVSLGCLGDPSLIGAPNCCCHAAVIVRGTFATLVKFKTFYSKHNKTQYFCYVFSAALKRRCAAVIVRGTFATLVKFVCFFCSHSHSPQSRDAFLTPPQTPLEFTK